MLPSFLLPFAELAKKRPGREPGTLPDAAAREARIRVEASSDLGRFTGSYGDLRCPYCLVDPVEVRARRYAFPCARPMRRHMHSRMHARLDLCISDAAQVSEDAATTTARLTREAVLREVCAWRYKFLYARRIGLMDMSNGGGDRGGGAAARARAREIRVRGGPVRARPGNWPLRSRMGARRRDLHIRMGRVAVAYPNGAWASGVRTRVMRGALAILHARTGRTGTERRCSSGRQRRRRRPAIGARAGWAS